jgi:hypothetical protein
MDWRGVYVAAVRTAGALCVAAVLGRIGSAAGPLVPAEGGGPGQTIAGDRSDPCPLRCLL